MNGRVARVGFLLLSIALLLAPCAAFAGGGGEAQKVTLRVWKAPYSDNDQGLLGAAFDEFKKAHPQVTIEFVVTPWETWVEKYTAAFAAGDPPEVFSAAQSFPYKFIQAGQVAALDKQGWAKALSAIYPANLLDAYSFEGHTYGVPYSFDGVTLVYNTELLKAAGIGAPPATYDELVAQAKRLTQDKNGDGTPEVWGYGLMGNESGEAVNMYYTHLMAYGGVVAKPDGSRCLLDSTECVRGVQFMVDLLGKHKASPPLGLYEGRALQSGFLRGEIAMMGTNPWFQMMSRQENPNLQWEAALIPTAAPGAPSNATLGAGEGWLISEACKNKELAWALIQALTKKEYVRKYLEAVSVLPARKDLLAEMYQDNKFMKTNLESTAHYLPLPKWPFIEWDLVIQEIQQAMLGKKTAEAAMKTAAFELNNKLKEIGWYK
jgi:multiple sugar transport system substrate-binding protein